MYRYESIPHNHVMRYLPVEVNNRNKYREVEIEKWVERGDKFVLEQDGASGHGGGPKARTNNSVAL